MAGGPLQVANFRLADTSVYLGVDSPNPAVSWAYSAPSDSQYWCQKSYILTLHSSTHANKNGGSYTVAGPRTSNSENIQWPKAFPEVESEHLYEIVVEAVLARCDRPSTCFDDWNFGSAKGEKLLPAGTTAQSLLDKIAKGNPDTAIVRSSLKFEAGILGGVEAWRKKAPKVGMITPPWDLGNWNVSMPVTVLQNKYTFKAKPVAARLYATAFGIYNVLINGRRVGESIMEPGWTEYARRVHYQTYNITEYFKEGENTVTVYVADGWYRGRMGPTVKVLKAKRAVFGKETGFMAIMDTYGADGKADIFYTGTTEETGWKCTRNTPISDSGIYDGEHHDARVDVTTTDNEHGEKGWKDVKVVAEAFTNPLQKLKASIAPPVRHTQSFQVKSTLKSAEGKMILDFGQNIAGRLRIKGSAPAGTNVSFVHVEVLNPDKTPNIIIMRDAKVTDSYTFSGKGVETWEPEFTYHGFRYVQVHPWVEGLEVEAKVYGSDLQKGLMKFKSTNPELDRLVQNIEWSAKGNFFGVPTDCPQRDERLGWTGDINVFGPTAAYIFDTKTFLKGFLQTVEDSQKIGGVHRPPVASPNVFELPRSHMPMAIYGDIIVTLPWTIYLTYGDTTLLNDLYESMSNYATKGIRRIESGPDAGLGAWASFDNYQFADWLNPAAPPLDPQLNGTDPFYVADTWLCRVTETMAKISTAIGREDDAKQWSAKAMDLIAKWRLKYLLPLVNTTATGEPPKLIEADSQTAYSIALNFHLLPENYIEPTIARLHYLIRKEDYHPSTGIVGTAEVLHAVSYPRTIPSVSVEDKIKSVNLAYKLLIGRRTSPSWLYPITMGATSIWERWDSILPDGTSNAPWMTSLNHYALGAPGKWIFENIGGITIENNVKEVKAAWRVVFDPIPNVEHGLTAAEFSYDSPKGLVECKWNYDQSAKTMSINVSLPGNVEGEIRVLGKMAKKIGAGKWSVKEKLEEKVWKVLEAGEGEHGKGQLKL
ncbi:hypothetical protein H072_5932 [Dactylellina haptotyla CBS 200.50]|uniref:alpha-L-rhamnosidase n=1 Tax=Dactylellina haptotyla (strain CBS 200.50) TaxID=1284197 RepID=S8BLI0_DACHA|nr:hypothetical protein H072_5932 [Dactylellina haptotyla CBS 200.50]